MWKQSWWRIEKKENQQQQAASSGSEVACRFLRHRSILNWTRCTCISSGSNSHRCCCSAVYVFDKKRKRWRRRRREDICISFLSNDNRKCWNATNHHGWQAQHIHSYRIGWARDRIENKLYHNINFLTTINMMWIHDTLCGGRWMSLNA